MKHRVVGDLTRLVHSLSFFVSRSLSLSLRSFNFLCNFFLLYPTIFVYRHFCSIFHRAFLSLRDVSALTNYTTSHKHVYVSSSNTFHTVFFVHRGLAYTRSMHSMPRTSHFTLHHHTNNVRNGNGNNDNNAVGFQDRKKRFIEWRQSHKGK